MPGAYTIDPTDSSRPLDTDELQYAAEEIRSLKAHIAAELAALGGPLPAWGLETRNALINGNFKVWQDGVSSSTNNAYIADMWRHSTDAAGVLTVSRVAGTQALNAISLRNSNITNAQYLRLEYYMEAADSAIYAGNSITVSFSAKANLGDGTVTVSVGYPSAEDNFTIKEELITASAVAVTSTNDRKEFTFTLTPSAATYTARTGLYIFITFTPDTTGDRDIVIENAQLEYGTAATLFEDRSYASELAKCQRYFFKLVDNTCIITDGPYRPASSYIFHAVRFPVTMRAAPAVTLLGTFAVVNCGQPILSAQITPDTCYLYSQVLSSAVAYFNVPSGVTGTGIKASARLVV